MCSGPEPIARQTTALRSRAAQRSAKHGCCTGRTRRRIDVLKTAMSRSTPSIAPPQLPATWRRHNGQERVTAVRRNHLACHSCRIRCATPASRPTLGNSANEACGEAIVGGNRGVPIRRRRAGEGAGIPSGECASTDDESLKRSRAITALLEAPSFVDETQSTE